MMEQLVLRETPAQRQVWKRKIVELRDDATSIRRQGEHFDRIVNTNVRHQKERDELLTKRHQRKVGSSQEERDLTNLSDEAQSWQQSSYMVDGLLANGEAQLNSLVEQRQRLRGVTKFLGQIGDRLGISNSTMRIIERRDITDAYFVFGGMVVTMIVIYFVWL
jgi:Golgi SNAP receptor complex protein 2